MSTLQRMKAARELDQLLDIRFDLPIRHEASNKELDTELVDVIHQFEDVASNKNKLSPENRAIALLESWQNALKLLRRWAPPGLGNELKQRLSRAITLTQLEPLSEAYLTDAQRRRLIQEVRAHIEPFIQIGLEFIHHRKERKAQQGSQLEVNGAVYDRVEKEIQDLLQNTLLVLKVDEADLPITPAHNDRLHDDGGDKDFDLNYRKWRLWPRSHR